MRIKCKRFTAVLLFLLLLVGCSEKKDNTKSEIEETTSITNNYEHISLQVTPKKSEKTKASESESEENTDSFEEFKNNVVVIGDSIALGYGSYERLPLKHVFAMQNVSPSTVREYTFDYNGGERTILGILTELQPEYIMLSMGLNDITTYSAENFAEKYKDVVKDISKVCPDTKIYIMGLSPVMSNCEYTTNKAINEYNDSLSKEFETYSERICFVNAASVLKDKNGCLNEKYSSGDGIHLTGEAYDLLLEELEKVI